MSSLADPSTRDLSSSQLKLLDELVFAPQYHQDRLYYHLELPSQGRYFRLGYAEYVFTSLLDGRTSIAQAVTLGARALRAEALSHSQAMSVAKWLLSNGLASVSDPSSIASEQARRGKKRFSWAQVNPFSMKVPCCRPDRWLSLLNRWMGWLFTPTATCIAAIVMIAGLLAVLSQWDRFIASSRSIFAPNNWLTLLIAWTLLKVCHELGHGLAAKRHGAHVREMGLLFVLFAPMAYIDVTSVWRLPSKWQRLHVAAAGIYVELLMAGLAALIWSRVEDPEWANQLYNLIVSASVTTILFNMNPLMRFDGYYILSDLIEIPNLSSEAAGILRNSALRVFYGEAAPRNQETGWRAWVITAYAVCSAAWKLLLCGSMLIAASVLGKGLGIVLVPLGIGLWFAKPLWSLLQDLLRRFHESRLSVLRATVVGTVVSGLLVAIYAYCPWPGTVSAPAIVDYVEGSQIRSRVSGFVEKIYVEDGQLVKAGDLLIQLRNEDLQYEREALRTTIAAKEAIERAAIDEHQTAQAQIAASETRAQRERLDEVERQWSALTVTAPHAGHVVARSLDARLGTHVAVGDPLLAVANEDEKELIFCISQQDLPAAMEQIGTEVRYRVGTRIANKGRLDRVDPRARQELPHPALAATSGGPLAVRPHTDERGNSHLELLEPRFAGVVRLSDASSHELASGQQVQVLLGRRSESVGEYLSQSVSRWVSQRLKILQAP